MLASFRDRTRLKRASLKSLISLASLVLARPGLAKPPRPARRATSDSEESKHDTGKLGLAHPRLCSERFDYKPEECESHKSLRRVRTDVPRIEPVVDLLSAVVCRPGASSHATLVQLNWRSLVSFPACVCTSSRSPPWRYFGSQLGPSIWTGLFCNRCIGAAIFQCNRKLVSFTAIDATTNGSETFFSTHENSSVG